MLNDNVPWIESPYFESILKSKNLTTQQSDSVLEYKNNGYVVIRDLLPQSLIDRVLSDSGTKGFNNDFPVKTQRNETRIQDMWQISEASKELACYPEILQYLKLLYGREPVPFQTLNFKYGTQQRNHSDTIHFSSLPARFMCGVWVALEDITEENGPVFYYPGSHVLPEYDFSYIIEDPVTTSYEHYRQYEDYIENIVAINKLEKKKFLAKRGDLLIWSSNIIHGGSPVIKQGSTRWSQVTHYFFKDCYYYTPMLSNMATRQLFLRRNLVNIQTGKVEDQTYNGKKLSCLETEKNLFSLTRHGIDFIRLIKNFMRSKSGK